MPAPPAPPEASLRSELLLPGGASGVPRCVLALALLPLPRCRLPLEFLGLLTARSGVLVVGLDTVADAAVVAELLRLRRVRLLPATLPLALPPQLGERPPAAAVALSPPPVGDAALLAPPALRLAAAREPPSAGDWREDRLLSASACCEADSFGDAPREEWEAGLFLRRLAAAAVADGDRPEETGDAPPVPPDLFVDPAGEQEDTPLLEDEDEKVYGLVRRVDIGGGTDGRPWVGEAPFMGVVGAPLPFLERSGVLPEPAPLVVESPLRAATAEPLAGDGEGDFASLARGRELDRRRLLLLPPDGVVNPLPPPPLDPPSPCADGVDANAGVGPGAVPWNNRAAGFGLFRPVRESGVACSPPQVAPARALGFAVPLPLPPPLPRASADPRPDSSPPDPRLCDGCFGLLGEARAFSAAMTATPGRRRRRIAPSRFTRA